MDKVISHFIGMFTNPIGQLRRLKEEGEVASLVPSIIYVLVMGVAAGILTAAIQMVKPPAPVAEGLVPGWWVWVNAVAIPLLSVLGAFITALILWGATNGFFKGSMGQYKTALAIVALPAAYSPVSAILSNAFPDIGFWLSGAIFVWTVVFMIWGAIIVQDAKPVQTIVIALIAILAIALMGAMAKVTQDRLLDSGQFGDLQGDFGDDIDFDALLQEDAEKAVAE